LLKVKGTYGVVEGTGDDHLRSADFFDVEKFPTIDVAVDSAQATSSLQVQLTVKGVTRDVDLPVTVTTLNDGAVQIVAKGTVDRSEFGVDGNMMGMIGDTTAVEATAVFVKQS
jgi:polyisoprenoid-binding protein YceI